jgi:hypothetical protein
MNLRLDGCIVPSAAAAGARVSYGHIVVLDDFVDEDTRRQLRRFLTADDGAGGGAAAHAGGAATQLPCDRWERRTADLAGGAPTWGVRQHVLEALAAGRPGAVLEVQTRLCRLYPEYDIAHMPSDAIQGGEATERAAKRPRGGAAGAPPGPSHATQAPAADCTAFLANAAAYGDSFRYHVDADPTSFPPGPWLDAFGDYFNGEPSRPLLVSLLLYLDDAWERDWAADTLFLDGDTDTGVFVRPKPGRAVLMDQDVVHRVSPPSAAAGGRPRLSLVWKLVMLPREGAQAAHCCLARPEWGDPLSFGSAARVEAVKRRLAEELRGGGGGAASGAP